MDELLEFGVALVYPIARLVGDDGLELEITNATCLFEFSEFLGSGSAVGYVA